MFDYQLALATGVDLPIPELETAIHQPTITEISMIGEQDFFNGIQILCVNKNMVLDDQGLLKNATNFQIFMMMLNEKQMVDKKQQVIQVLSLLFPSFKIVFTPRSMLLNQGERNVIIDEENFEILQKVLEIMFCLNKTDQATFNPADERARKIAEKLMKAREKVAKEKSKEGGGSMFGQYLSILTVGIDSMSLRDCCKLTMYQLQDLVERYNLYVNWDLDMKTRLAGGKPDSQADNWMKNIH